MGGSLFDGELAIDRGVATDLSWLRETVPALGVPVFFVEGRHDHEAPAELAEQYFAELAAPSKELAWFEDSAHLPNTEERERFTRFMVEKVLPLAVRPGGR